MKAFVVSLFLLFALCWQPAQANPILHYDFYQGGYAGAGPLGKACEFGVCGAVARDFALNTSAELIQVTAQVPEPATYLLLMVGFAGLVWARRSTRN